MQVIHVVLEFLDDVLGFPDEYAGVPQEFVGVVEHLRQFGVRLFRECFYCCYFLLVVFVLDLNVSVFGFRPCGSDADGEKPPVFSCKFHASLQVLQVGGIVGDEVVGGEDNHDGVGVYFLNFVGGVGDAGGGVPDIGFEEDVFAGDFRDLLPGHFIVFFPCDDVDTVGREEVGDAFIGLTDETFSCMQDV